MGARRVLLALAAAVLAVSSYATPVLGAQKCQCVAYVANIIGHMGVYAAADAGPALKRMGHKHYQPSLSGRHPKKWDIVVFQRGVLGASRRYGHIGFVQKYAVAADGKLVLWLRSSNVATRPLFKDAGCRNVSIFRLPEIKWGKRGIDFYHR